MMHSLELFLHDMTGSDVRIVERKTFKKREGEKFFPIDRHYLFVYREGIPPATLYTIKRFLQEFFEEYARNVGDLKKLKILQKELESVLETNEEFFSSEGDLEHFFSFIHGDAFRFVLIENDHVIINRGIDPFTIRATRGKLKKRPLISLPIQEGELYAIKEGWYAAIVQSDKKISTFTKKVIKSRLLWLSRLYEAKMHYNIDRLTGLYTREKLLSDLHEDNRSKPPFLFINLKNFKTVNEIHTTAIGDLVLKEISEKLKEHAPEKSIYRVYGDRFAIELDATDSPLTFAKHILSMLERPIMLYNPAAKDYVTISLLPQTLIFESSIDEILEKANFSFKKSEEKLIRFESDIAPLMEEESHFFSILQRALENDGIVPFFQRIVDKETADTVYFEALMRIIDDEKIHLPVRFIEVAKRRGIYKKLNFTMIAKSFEAVRRLNRKISINIDIYDVLQKDFFPFIEQALQEQGIDGRFIQFELLETEDIYTHFDEVKLFLEKIHNLGCKVALDDFGKGYSNFANIKDLPIDLLKIDMSLVTHIDTDARSFHIVVAMSELCRLLGIETTAEGISTEEIFKKIKEIPVDNLQGFFFDRPKPLEEIIASSPDS